MIMISKDVIGIYAGGLRSYARGGRIAAGGGLFAGGPFTAWLIAGGLFASGLNAAPRWFRVDVPLSQPVGLCGPVATLETDANEQLIPSTVCPRYNAPRYNAESGIL